MAVSITSRPSTWSAVKNPVVYKFATTGGSFTNYRIEVEVFRAADDTSLTDGVKFSFTPDADDVTIADVSQIIKAYLKADWIKPVTGNDVETDAFLKFYIKYQELYDGSATSVVDDVANPRYGVLGALQIPSADGNDLTDYVPADSTKKFLSIFEHGKLWRDYPSTLSFINPDGIRAERQVKEYDESGNLIATSVATGFAEANDDAVNRLDILSGLTLDDDTTELTVALLSPDTGEEVLANGEFDPDLSGWTDDGTGAGPWVSSGDNRLKFHGSGSGGAGISPKLSQTFTQRPAGTYFFTLTNFGFGIFSSHGDILIRLLLAGVEVKRLIDQPVTGLAVNDFEQSHVVSSAFDEIEISMTMDQADDFFIDDISLVTYGLVTEELTFDVEDACDNPILLFWKNSLGGDAFWLFDHGQESGYNFSGTKKAKRMTLFAEHLTLNQWEALNELNTLGEVYQENIPELTSSVNKTAVRDGAQVYIMDTDGNKTGVIVIPSPSIINTKDETHSIEIQIEYPERIE